MTERHALLVASTGGHLEEMLRLASRFEPSFTTSRFITFEGAQAESLLAHQPTEFIRAIPPRGWREAVQALAPAVTAIKRHRITDVISTGAAIAAPFALAARALGVRAHYIESAARTGGPSMTGSLISRVPGVHLYTQHESWSSSRWRFSGSVFDHLHTSCAETRAARSPSKVVVTLGTMRDYPFDRAVRSTAKVLAEVGTADREVLWQIGDAAAPKVIGKVRGLVPADELAEAISQADLVVAHAGVGSSLRILESGRAPVLLYRQQRYGEHVDDHQLLIAADLQRRGLVVARDPDNFTAADAQWALERRVTTHHHRNPFTLSTRKRSSQRGTQA